MAKLKILISGAGPSGNALAFWLSRLKHTVTVIERWPELRINGLQIDLRGAGITVLKRMGLESAFRANAAPEQGMEIVDTHGKRWAYFPAQKPGAKVQAMTSEFEIMRGDLCRIIYDQTRGREGVGFRFGTEIESYIEGEDGVEVTFKGGKTERFDLLIGADGSGSRTRKLMLGKENDVFKTLNECIAYFTVDRKMKEGEGYNGVGIIGTNGRFLFTRRHSPHKIQVYMICHSMHKRLKDIKRGDVEKEKKEFAQVFRDAGWEAEELVDEMLKSEDFYCQRQGVVNLNSWSTKRVTLIADAAHAPSGDVGMGTTCALVGAYVLAGEISQHCASADEDKIATGDDIAKALRAYEDKFRPFVNPLQKGMGDPGWFDNFQLGTVTIKIVYWFAWFVSIVRLDLLAFWFLSQKTDGWQLPEYEALPTQDSETLEKS